MIAKNCEKNDTRPSERTYKFIGYSAAVMLVVFFLSLFIGIVKML